ncbi:MAG: hypothetical protein AAGN66_06020 [Acidobacteriota bacterium]
MGAGFVAATGCAPGGSAAAELDAATIEKVRRTTIVLSKVYEVDQPYRSMMGPWEQQEVRLAQDIDDDALLFITGYRAVMVGADGETSMPQDFMCHSNLDIDVARHGEIMGPSTGFSPRLFTLSQGQLEVRFPPGFGIPVRASEAMSLTTQVLNLNNQTADVRHRIAIEYVTDTETGGAMRPLLPAAAYGLALLEGDSGHFGVATPDQEVHGPGCLVEATASDHAYEDGLGRTFSGHWQVPPGRQENRTLVTQLMRVPYETTIHYIAVHLHPFAESLELRDLTEDRTLFRSEAQNYEDRIGLANVDYLASVEGIPVYPDHEYELLSVYDNSSSEMQDSMAVMYIYLRDLETEKRLSEIRSDGSG